MPSLLAIAAVDRPGGAEIGLLRLAPRLRDRGWSITFTTPGAGPLRDAVLDLGLGHAALPVGGLARGAGARALASFPAARRLASRHDVTYLNGGVSARLLRALPGGAGTVLHVHDLVDRVPAAWTAAGVILADSAAVAARLGPDLAARAHVVGCPIEPDPPAVAAPWARNGRPVVGYVGRIEPRKGVLDLVRAAPAIDARVVVVGDDSYGADPEYERAVRESPDVEHHGWIENAAGLMGAFDVLVLPSQAEPFGTVLAEAMNAGTPVVATRVGGLADVVADGVTGRLVEPGDPAALAAAVREVLARRAEMGSAGRERARRWHADAYAARVHDLLTPLASRERKGQRA